MFRIKTLMSSYIYCKQYYINILLKIKIHCNLKKKKMQVLTIDISYICVYSHAPREYI